MYVDIQSYRYVWFFYLNPESGLAPTLANDGTSGSNALKLAQSVHLAEQKFRSEEDQTSKSYFLRAFANDYNFTNNPTFVSGSDKRIRHTDMLADNSCPLSAIIPIFG